MVNNVAKQLVDLKKKTHPELKQIWRDLYNAEPPEYKSDYLYRRLAYRVQEIACGGLSDETKKAIKNLQKGKISGRNKDYLPPVGTQIIRNFRGVEHRVTILPDGFEYLGKKFKSLSIIARTITGVHWSGPVFFGLKR